MSSNKIMRMIGRMEILVDSAERIAAKYPNILKGKGFFGSLFEDKEENEARDRFQSICYEVLGVGANIGDALKEYGITLKSDKMDELIDKTDECSGREVINLMRAFIGFVRSKAYNL